MEKYGSKLPIVLEMQYLPPIQYFGLGWQNATVYLDIFENYQKQSYRNRCRVMTANGVYELVVPIKHTHSKQVFREVQIDYSQKWVMNHWRTIYSAYGKAPFFEFYADEFEKLYRKKFQFLVDLNLEILTICLKILGFSQNFYLSEKYLQMEELGEIKDFRSFIHPKKAVSPDELARFKPYQQVFGKSFVPNLSIIDLIMCEGPNASDFLNKDF